MGFIKGYREERAKHTARESVATLSDMKKYFLDGRNWAQGVYQGAGNTRCLVGAAEHLRESSVDDAKFWLQQAIAERTGGAVATIEEFNDRQESFEEVAAVISRAKQLAAANLPARLPAPVVATPARLVPSSSHRPQPNPWDDGDFIDVEAEPVPHQAPPKRDRESSVFHKLADWWD